MIILYCHVHAAQSMLALAVKETTNYFGFVVLNVVNVVQQNHIHKKLLMHGMKKGVITMTQINCPHCTHYMNPSATHNKVYYYCPICGFRGPDKPNWREAKEVLERIVFNIKLEPCKPCIFCNNNVKVETIKVFGSWVKCPKCFFSGPTQNTEELAIKQYNSIYNKINNET
jgi:hypothetical protein